jgi:hypothetical protein
MKYPCQGPNCHTRPTKDRFTKSAKRLKGRNAYFPMDEQQRGPFTIFCTTGCQNDWLYANVANIVNQRPITFNRERKISEQTFHITEGGWLRRDEDRD